MWISSNQFDDGGPIPGENAFCVIDPDSHVTLSDNKNPDLKWGDVPDGTASFALLMIDVDVPTVADDVNQEGREIQPDLPRTDFAHWVLADLPGDTRSIEQGSYSDGVTARGKDGLSGIPKEGVNDYTGWFASDPDMAGTYKGYDGPCPPWNDSIVHRYVFTLLALDVTTLGLPDSFTVADVRAASSGHVLAEASLTGSYTLNPGLTS